jgi:hypothetical protein
LQYRLGLLIPAQLEQWEQLGLLLQQTELREEILGFLLMTPMGLLQKVELQAQLTAELVELVQQQAE